MQTHLSTSAQAGKTSPACLTLLLENTSTYMVKAKITYFVNGHTQIQKHFLPGGSTAETDTIAQSATDLEIELDFERGEPHLLQVREPQRAWKNGQALLMLTGVRPGKTGAKWID